MEQLTFDNPIFLAMIALFIFNLGVSSFLFMRLGKLEGEVDTLTNATAEGFEIQSRANKHIYNCLDSQHKFSL